MRPLIRRLNSIRQAEFSEKQEEKELRTQDVYTGEEEAQTDFLSEIQEELEKTSEERGYSKVDIGELINKFYSRRDGKSPKII